MAVGAHRRLRLLVRAQPLDRGRQRRQEALSLRRGLRRQLGGQSPDLGRLTERRQADPRRLRVGLPPNPAQLGGKPRCRRERTVCPLPSLFELIAEAAELTFPLDDEVGELIRDPVQLTDPRVSLLRVGRTGEELRLTFGDRRINRRAPVAKQGPLELPRGDDEEARRDAGRTGGSR